MACWCETEGETPDVIHVQSLVEDLSDEDVDVHHDRDVPFHFCPSCGRDLRLPVPRAYEHVGPPVCFHNANEAWFVDSHDGSRIIMMASAMREIVKLWPRLKYFGPVTVAPREVPE